MAAELNKLCKMLKSDDPELRWAAARVLCELKPRDPHTVRSLGELVSDASSPESIIALRALGAASSKVALQFLIPCLNAEEERREAAKEAISNLGRGAVAALRKEFPVLNTAGRIAAVDLILDSEKELNATPVLSLLTDNDSVEVAGHICERLRGIIESLGQRPREELFAKLKRFLAAKKTRQNHVAVMAGLRLLDFLHYPKATPIFLKYMASDYPPTVRRHALAALSNLPPQRHSDPETIRMLLDLVADRTYPDLVELALRILSNSRIPASLTDEMVKLLYNRQSAVRRLAVRTLGGFNSHRAAKALLDCLDRSDWELGSETVAALRRMACTADLIVKEIEKTDDTDKARSLATILRGVHAPLSATTQRALTKRFFELLDEQHDMTEIYYTILSDLDGEKLDEAVVDRARKHKAAGRFDAVEHHLRMLAQSGPVNSDVKFELGLARLKLSPKKLDKTERTLDPALPLFAEVLRDPAVDLAGKVEQDIDLLDLDDLYYLGFHFVEGADIEKSFGARMLQLVLKLGDDTPQAHAARAKLVAHGQTVPSKSAPAKKKTTKKPAAKKTAEKTARRSTRKKSTRKKSTKKTPAKKTSTKTKKKTTKK